MHTEWILFVFYFGFIGRNGMEINPHPTAHHCESPPIHCPSGMKFQFEEHACKIL